MAPTEIPTKSIVLLKRIHWIATHRMLLCHAHGDLNKARDNTLQQWQRPSRYPEPLASSPQWSQQAVQKAWPGVQARPGRGGRPGLVGLCGAP
jgi:hypothetical protein